MVAWTSAGPSSRRRSWTIGMMLTRYDSRNRPATGPTPNRRSIDSTHPSKRLDSNLESAAGRHSVALSLDVLARVILHHRRGDEAHHGA